MNGDVTFASSGLFSGGREEGLKIVVQELDGAAAPVLQPQREAALAAEARNRRRHDGERHRFRDAAPELGVQLVDDGAGVKRGSCRSSQGSNWTK